MNNANELVVNIFISIGKVFTNLVLIIVYIYIYIYIYFFFFFFISFIGHTYKRLHIIIQTKKITVYTSNGAIANRTTRPMQGATPKLN